MRNPRDCWHEPYFFEDGSVNPNCHLFDGCSEKKKQQYLEWCKQE